MHMEVVRILKQIQAWIQDTAGSSSLPTPEHFPGSTPEKISDEVYEVYRPVGRPSVEIVFFHGLQLGHSDNAHISTWVSRDKSELWLLWLLDEFPEARILVISYDAFAERTGEQGNTGMYVTRENLLQSFTKSRAKIGQDGCPVVFVGHCLGGLVAKEILVQANATLSLDRPDEVNETVQKLLSNVKGLFFYASPHEGSRLADGNAGFRKSPLFEDLKVLNEDTARLNEDFRRLRANHRWKTFGVAEAREVTLGNFTGLVVPEGSARHGVDGFYTDKHADHFDVCRPVDINSPGFYLLSNFVAEVVKEDEGRLCTPIGFLPDGVGLEALVDKVRQKLDELQQIDRVPRLAIVGIGGIGKTTLAKAVFDSISGEFDYAIFVDEVKKLTAHKVDNQIDIHLEILSRLTEKGRKVDPPIRWNKLEGKRVLLVLDDVDSESHVKVMTDRFSESSRFIVTSRDSSFLRPENFELYPVKQLDEKDSKELFCLHAFKKRKAPRRYKEHVSRFAEKCGGLPLALKVSGKYLCSRSNESLWDDAFTKLSEAKPLNGRDEDGLWSILRVSYEDLAEQERDMFLDVATCFHGKELIKIQEAWRVCEASPVAGWSNLVNRGMVKQQQGRIWMHEVLRDLGRSIAGNTRVVDLKQLTKQLLNKEMAQVRILEISLGDRKLAMGFLGGCMKLKILWVDGNDLGDFLDWELDRNISAVFPPNLAFLRMRSYKRPEHVVLEQLSCMLSLQSIIFEMEFEDHHDGGLEHFISSVGQLHQLEYLQLYGCESLRTFSANFENLSQLHHLELHNCLKLTTLQIGNLSHLKHLKLHNCRDLTSLPAEFGNLLHLEHLELHHWPKLTGLPAELGSLFHLHHFEIHHCPKITRLPAEFGKLSELHHFELHCCRQFTTLPAEFGNLENLEQLTLEKIDNLLELPNSFVRLKALKVLEIENCRGLVIRLSCLWELCNLERLQIVSCQEISGLDAWYTLTVRERTISDLTVRERTISDPTVRERTISDWTITRKVRDLTMKELPWTRGVFSKDGEVIVRACSSNHPDIFDSHRHSGSLETLPPRWGHIRNMQRLTIVGGELPHWLLKSHELKRLVIEGSDASELPEFVGQLSVLEEFEIHNCHRLRALPDTLGQLGALRKLTIWGCSSLIELPKSLGQLRGLKSFRVFCCSALTTLPDTLGQLGALEELRICKCNGLGALLDTPGLPGALQKFRIEACHGLHALPDMLGTLQALRALEIYGCSSLTDLPESVWRLPEPVLHISGSPCLDMSRRQNAN